MRKMTRDERKTEMYNKLSSLDQALTAGELAARMNLTPSPYFRELLKELTREGWLFQSEREQPNGTIAFLYSVTDQRSHI